MIRNWPKLLCKKSQAKFQRLVEDIGDKFVVFSHTGPDAGDIVTYVSNGVQSVFGVSKELVIGQPWQSVVTWVPEDADLANHFNIAISCQTLDFIQTIPRCALAGQTPGQKPQPNGRSDDPPHWYR
jgi:PAS domain-containing protein